LLDYLEPVHVRQTQVQHDYIGRLFGGLKQSILSGCRLLHAKTVCAERRAEETPDFRLVFDH
jgi:hypothetical protein